MKVYLSEKTEYLILSYKEASRELNFAIECLIQSKEDSFLRNASLRTLEIKKHNLTLKAIELANNILSECDYEKSI